MSKLLLSLLLLSLLSLARCASVGSALRDLPVDGGDNGDDGGSSDGIQVAESVQALMDGVDPTRWLIEEQPDVQVAASNDTKCCKCVKASAQCIVDHAVKHLDKTCKHASHGHVKDHCRYFQKHRKRVKGMIIAHVRPHALGYAYCVGKQRCEMKKGGDSPLQQGGGDEDGEQQAPFRWQEMESTVLSAVLRDLILSDDSDDDGDDNGLDALTRAASQEGGADEEKLCPFCIRLASKRVMKHVCSRIKHMCKRSEEPRTKDWCKWANKNRELVLGMLLVHVRPGEWGCGYCFGKGLCHSK